MGKVLVSASRLTFSVINLIRRTLQERAFLFSDFSYFHPTVLQSGTRPDWIIKNKFSNVGQAGARWRERKHGLSISDKLTLRGFSSGLPSPCDGSQSWSDRLLFLEWLLKNEK